MGFRENNMTVAEKLADVIYRNWGGKDIKIEKRENETFLSFLHTSWGNEQIQGIFYYCGLNQGDWIKSFDISLHDKEIKLNQKEWKEKSESENNQQYWFYPKRYGWVLNETDCPNWPKKCMNIDDKDISDCQKCIHNIALMPVIEVQFFLKLEKKDCVHNFIYRKDWENDICNKCGFMRIPDKKEKK